MSIHPACRCYRLTVICALVLTAVSGATALRAQVPDRPLVPPPSGERVRWTMAHADGGTSSSQATVIGHSGDSLFVRHDGGAQRVLLMDELTLLEVRTESGSRALGGAAAGGVTFGLLGYLAGKVSDCVFTCQDTGAGEIGLVLGGLGGAALGGLIGSLFSTDEWARIGRKPGSSGQAALSILPTWNASGPGASLTWRHR